MYSQQDLMTEVQTVVDTAIEKNVVVRTEWLAGSVMTQHPGIEGEDRDFYILCAWAHVKTAVREVVRRYKVCDEGEKVDAQLLLPGFEILQVAYAAERDGVSCIVPIDQLTEGEIYAKIDTYQAKANGLQLHAREFLRYLKQRRVKEEPPASAATA